MHSAHEVYQKKILQNGLGSPPPAFSPSPRYSRLSPDKQYIPQIGRSPQDQSPSPSTPKRNRPASASVSHRELPAPYPFEQPQQGPPSARRPASAPKPSTLSILRSTSQANFRSEDVPVVELQAAFENAFQRTVHVPPPSIVDTVLSSQWRPRARPLAKGHFRQIEEREKGWDTRTPATANGIQPYDAVLDFNCKRVIENPNFKRQMKQTRPSSIFLFDRRIVAEERRVQSAAAKLRPPHHSPPPSWLTLVTTPAPTPVFDDDDSVQVREVDDDLDMGQAVRSKSATQMKPSRRLVSTPQRGSSARPQSRWSPLQRSALDRPSTAPTYSRSSSKPSSSPSSSPSNANSKAAQRQQQQQQQSDESGNSEGMMFSSLNQVLSDGPHLPTVFAHLTARLEKLWAQLYVPNADRKEIRRLHFSKVSTANLSQLFFHVSRWTQYQTQLTTALTLILEREQFLKDVHDHLSLSGGILDEGLKKKLSEFYALSLRTLNSITTLKSLYAGSDPSQSLLQDYVAKIKLDTAQLRAKHVGPAASPEKSAHDDSGEHGYASDDPSLQQNKVHLAAELVLSDVSREALVAQDESTNNFIVENARQIAAPVESRSSWHGRPLSRR